MIVHLKYTQNMLLFYSKLKNTLLFQVFLKHINNDLPMSWFYFLDNFNIFLLLNF
jgi:hypothetical protein